MLDILEDQQHQLEQLKLLNQEQQELLEKLNAENMRLSAENRNLTVQNQKLLVVIAFMREKSYLRADIFGIYILIKINELSHKDQNQDDIKGIVRNAFIARNMNVDEYIDMIERECSICRSEINYVQKEKMKEYLLKTF